MVVSIICSKTLKTIRGDGIVFHANMAQFYTPTCSFNNCMEIDFHVFSINDYHATLILIQTLLNSVLCVDWFSLNNFSSCWWPRYATVAAGPQSRLHIQRLITNNLLVWVVFGFQKLVPKFSHLKKELCNGEAKLILKMILKQGMQHLILKNIAWIFCQLIYKILPVDCVFIAYAKFVAKHTQIFKKIWSSYSCIYVARNTIYNENGLFFKQREPEIIDVNTICLLWHTNMSCVNYID